MNREDLISLALAPWCLLMFALDHSVVMMCPPLRRLRWRR